MCHDGYRYTTGLLLSCTRRQLIRIADKATLDIANRYTVYTGLDRAQTIATAQQNFRDVTFVLARKPVGGGR